MESAAPLHPHHQRCRPDHRQLGLVEVQVEQQLEPVVLLSAGSTHAAWYERLHEVEQLFFATHREYKEEAHKSCGVGLLKDKLTGILVARVQERVPEFAKSIRATRAGPLMTIRQDLNPLVDESKMSDKLMEVASLLKDEWSYQVAPCWRRTCERYRLPVLMIRLTA